MFFLTPKYLKQGRLYIKEAKKRLAYNRDQWSPGIIQDFDEATEALQKAVKVKDKEGVASAQASLEGLWARHCPRGKDAWIGENIEVIMVAIIIALGIRTYILQPFTIPTQSMYPTLCGIMSKKTDAEPPNMAVRAWEKAAYGRTYHNVIALADEEITEVKEVKWMFFFTYTHILTNKNNEYWVNEANRDVNALWATKADKNGPTMVGMTFRKGEPIVRGYTDTGDHVFVDKVSYHFRAPKRGEVFVFTTTNIPMPRRSLSGPPPMAPSEFYIKRLAGLPGDTLRIDAPRLFINGELAKESTFQRVMSGINEYHGYTQAKLLSDPRITFKIDPGQYFALGDNSGNSSDSREWGTVPEDNLMGAGFFVYWPFCRDIGSHFGLIR